MPKLKYTIGYIDLKKSQDDIFSQIKTRTEIRKAEKSAISIEIFTQDKPQDVITACIAILKDLLIRELVPFSNAFVDILKDASNYLLVAKKNGEVASFIVVSPRARNPFSAESRTGYLELSGTNDKFKLFCPNYLLIWTAIILLKNEKYDYFNLGLLEYIDSNDADLGKVAFFKRKWGVVEKTDIEHVSNLRYVYIKYFKRYRLIKKTIYELRGKFTNERLLE